MGEERDKGAGLVVSTAIQTIMWSSARESSTRLAPIDAVPLPHRTPAILESPSCECARGLRTPLILTSRKKGKTHNRRCATEAAPCWTVEKTDNPHETFTIMEDATVVLSRIVFSMCEIWEVTV